MTGIAQAAMGYSSDKNSTKLTMCVYGKVDTVVRENFTIKSFSVMV